MHLRTRTVIAAAIFLLLALSFIVFTTDRIRDYVPQFSQIHVPDSILHTFGRPSESHEQPSDGPPQDGGETKPSETPPTVGQAKPSSGTRTELEDALQKFLDLPVLSYDESLKANSKTCATKQINFDRFAVNDNQDTWPEISSEKIQEWRKNIVDHMRQKIEEERAGQKKLRREKISGGKGIVMAGGDHDAAIRAQASIRLMKSYNCSMPVEIFHFPGEISRSDRKLLEGLSKAEKGQAGMTVTLREVKGVTRADEWKQFQIKGAAIQQSSFDEILYLDTDSYPLRNPEYIFETRQWKDTGLLLWPDYTKSHPTNPVWRLLGQQCRSEYEVESGQIFIQRSLHQDIMWLVEYFALHHSEFYSFMGGDRDSFRAAALLLGKKWAGPGRLNAAAGVGNKEDSPGGGHTMLQADPEGRWMFVHANLIKHASFGRPLWSRIQRVAEDTFTPGHTYGSIETPNDKIGNGVKLDVNMKPRMSTAMTPFKGVRDSAVTIEDWDSYEELKGFEEKWFGFGGVN